MRGALLEKVRPTLELATMAMLIAFSTSLVLGTLAALRHRSWVDRLSTGLALGGTSVPDFVVGLLLIVFVARRWGYFPIFGYAPMSDGIGEWLRHMILPALALSLGLMGLLTPG